GSHHLRPGFRDRQDVLETNPEFPVLVDSGLVTERHTRLHHDLAAAHEVRPLVTFESDAVAESVSESPVVGPIARVGDDFARDGIDVAAFFSWRGEFNCATLRLVHDVENSLDFRAD